MKYTIDDIKLISLDQLNPKYYERALVAFNGLKEIFSEEWIENEIAFFFTDPEFIKIYETDRMYKGINDLEKIVFLWEDLELLKNLDGFEDLIRKLKNGIRFDNVDLEITIASDLIRCKIHKIELEPNIDCGTKKSDCRIQSIDNNVWTYIEITRKQEATTERNINERGHELAKIVSSLKPERRCVLVIKEELDVELFEELKIWLLAKPDEGEYMEKAIFFSVEHNTDDSRIALQYARTPISIRQSHDIYSHAFGVTYLHIPDYGAEKKLLNKQYQLPLENEGILFIDLSIVAGGFEDWSKQIQFTEEVSHFSTIVLIRDLNSSNGYQREIKIIENVNSKNPLGQNTLLTLEVFKNIRQNKNLIY